MSTANTDYQDQLRQLAELMLAVAGESVTLMKRHVPEQVLTLKRQDEWSLYLEFLKIMFNLTDRVAALHIPLKDQLAFMNGLEDAVSSQLKSVLEPAFGNQADHREIVMTIGGAVAESRQVYERYKFLITEESKSKSEMFQEFGEKVAALLGAPSNARLSSAATLCASAAAYAPAGMSCSGHARSTWNQSFGCFGAARRTSGPNVPPAAARNASAAGSATGRAVRSIESSRRSSLLRIIAGPPRQRQFSSTTFRESADGPPSYRTK